MSYESLLGLGVEPAIDTGGASSPDRRLLVAGAGMVPLAVGLYLGYKRRS